MQYIIILKIPHRNGSTPRVPSSTVSLFNEVVIQSCWCVYILVRWGLDQGLKPEEGDQKRLSSLPHTPPQSAFPPSCLQILGQKSQGFWCHLHILHPCLIFLWPDLVPPLRTFSTRRGHLRNGFTLQVVLWSGFTSPAGVCCGPHTSLFKFLQENSQDQHLLRPFRHPRLRRISS